MHILVVDDSKTIRHVLKRMLQDFGYVDIEEAGNYNEACSCIKEWRPDLILSDLHMPGRDGTLYGKVQRGDAVVPE